MCIEHIDKFPAFRKQQLCLCDNDLVQHVGALLGFSVDSTTDINLKVRYICV